MTKFYDRQDEERADWRQDEVTRSAIAMLKEHLADAVQAVLTSAASATEAETRVAVGFQRGLSRAIDLLENDR
jgi:predicted ArsR family transcriptional regulator